MLFFVSDISAKSLMCSQGMCFEPTLSEESLKNVNEVVVYTMNSDGTLTPTIVPVQGGTLSNFADTFSELLNGGEEILVEETEDENGNIIYQIISITHNHGLTDSFLSATGQFYYNKPIQPATAQIKETIATIKGNVNPIQEVNAQEEESTVYFPGLGYNILQPIKTFWNVNRNISYGILILIVMYNAFLILFQAQTGSGKENVTLANTIPSLIISLILITFSYAISGAFIDLMSLGANFVQAVLVSSPGSPGYNSVWNSKIVYDPNEPFPIMKNLEGAIETTEKITNQDIKINNVEEIPGKYGVQIDDPLMSTWLVFGTSEFNVTDINSATGILPDMDIIAQTGPLGNIASGFITMFGSAMNNNIVNSLASQLLNLILSFAALMASLKVFWALLGEYIKLVLYPIVSPFLFLIAAIPAFRQEIIQSYFKTMLKASLSFVVIYALYLLVIIITHEPYIGQMTFLPPLLGYNPENQLEASGTLVRMLLGYGLFLAAPTVPEQLSKIIEGGGKIDFGAIGQSILKETGSAAGKLIGGGSQIIDQSGRKKLPS